MKLELEKHEVKYIDDVLHDKFFIYSNKDPIIQDIREKIENAENDAWREYVMSKVTW